MSPDAPARPSGQPFDPRPHLRRVAGQREALLDVRGRLLWLRAEHPEARVSTEHVLLDEQHAVFRATVELPAGARSSGYGAAAAAESKDYIERAETRAIGRALAVLGFGIQYTADFDLLEPEAAAPVPVPVPESESEPEPVRPVPTAVEEPEPVLAEKPAAESRPATPRVAEPPRIRVVPPAQEAALDPEPTPRPAPVQAPEASPAEPEPFDMADYSWNDFWRWARPLGYRSRTELDELLGVATEELTPREVRRLLLQHRGEQGQGV
ncbi:MAG TPA: hypothetical protein VFI42_07520 [Thermomicrobiaceae bacterium]|nr:hypothetical protein [Thermomicrobiaceae bacterium]